MPDDGGSLVGLSQRLPPSNVIAEQALLGALLTSNKTLYRVGDFLRAEMFADPVNARVFQVIETRVRAGQLVDAVTLKVAFEHSGILEEVGGTPYLAQLLTAMVAPLVAVEYARAIHDAWLRRQLIEFGSGVVHAAFGEADGEMVLSEAMTGLAQLAADGGRTMAGVATLGDAARQAIAGYEAAYRGEPSAALRCGFLPVDQVLGGFTPGHLIVLGGRSGHGKSALAMQIAEGVAGRLAEAAANAPPFSGAGGYVVMFSQEMPAAELGGRSVASVTRIPGSSLAAGELNVGRGKALIDAQQYLDGLPLLIVDRSGLTAEDIVLTTQALAGRYRVRMVIIDHLQLIGIDKGAAKLGASHAFGQTTMRLKKAAKDLNVPVLVLSQLVRDVDRRPDPRPRKDDLPFAGEADADVIALLWRPELYHPSSPPEHNGKESEEAWQRRKEAWHRKKIEIENRAELLVAKRRGGKERVMAVLEFDGEITAFRAPTPRYEAPDLYTQAAE